MRLRSAVLLLAAAVAATEADALQASYLHSISVDHADDPVQRHLRTGHSESEERMYSGIDAYEALKTGPFIKELKGRYVAAGISIPKFVHEWGRIDWATQNLSNEEKKILVDHIWEPSTFSEDAAKRFMEGRDESAVIYKMKTLISTNDVGLRYIGDRLQSILMIWWKSKQLSAVDVFNLLQVDKSVSNAEKKATMFEIAVCLAHDPTFVTWEAYVHRIDKHGPAETMSSVLVPAYLDNKKWTTILDAANTMVARRSSHMIPWGAKKPRGASKRKGQHEENTGVYAVKRLRVMHQGRYVKNDDLGAL